MSRRYALYGDHSRSLLTYQGRVIVHTDRAELEFLCPFTRVVECPAWVRDEDTLPIHQHPRYVHVRFPLHREDFRT